MTKLKPMLPTLRERKRYVAYELMSDAPIRKDVSESVVNRIRDALGAFDSANAGVMSIEYDAEGQKGILRIAHDMVDKARTALTFQRDFGGEQVIPRVMGISGTLKKARSKYMN